MAELNTQGINLDGLEEVFRICGWQVGMAALGRRISEFVIEKDRRVGRFLSEMEKYDKPRLQGSPATENNLPKTKVGGRPRRAGTLITKTFRYEGETARLGILCQALKALGWIALETDAQAFIDQFSGSETVRQRVIWTGGVNTIAELFRRLVNERRLVALPSGHSIWVMVNARFWEKERRQEFGTDRLRSTHSPKGDDQPIAYLVNILDPEMSLDEVRQMLESQR